MSNVSLYKTEFRSGLSIFFAIWTFGFIYPEITGNSNIQAHQWFSTVGIIMISAALISAFFFKRSYIMGPGISIGWFAFNQVANLGPYINFAYALLILAIILICISHLDMIKTADKLLPNHLQISISVGIGLFFVKMACQKQFHNLDLNYSNILFLLSVILLMFFRIKQISSGLIYTVILLIGINYFVVHPQINQLFTLPSFAGNIFDLSWSELDMKILIQETLALSLFSFFDTATGVFCLQEIERSLFLTPAKQNLAKAYRAVGLNNIVSAIFLCGPNTLFIESAIGIQTGASQALSRFVLAGCFAVFLFCYPLQAYIPHELFAGILCFIGLSLLSPLYQLKLQSSQEVITSLVLIVIIILTQSILYGFAVGMLIHYAELCFYRQKIDTLSHFVTLLSIICLISI